MDFEDKDRMEEDSVADPFYSESNMNYLRSIMQDIKEGKVRFTEHELVEDD